MNLIYLHGFQSGPQSIKAQCLKRYLHAYSEHRLHLPDLNHPPLQVLQQLEQQLSGLDQVAYIGSSLGGFYATQLAARHPLPCVLINPVIQPWRLFGRLFAQQQLPYAVTPQWSLDQAQLNDLQNLARPFVQDASKLLVLLQQGDEVLDYREAQGYYSQAKHQSLVMTEQQGNHAMDNFMDKIPMMLQFLSDSIK